MDAHTNEEDRISDPTGPFVKVAFGSFHFGLKETAKPPATLQGYLDGVRSALEDISSVEEVTMPKVSPGNGGRDLDIPAELPDFKVRGEFFPRLGQGHDISFTLRIPTRTQREVFSALPVENLGERFLVTMTHDWGRPIAMIHPLDADTPQVSRSVAVVREFLRREFERLSDTAITFECMGPSPAHADFHLTPNPKVDPLANDLFEILAHRRYGYHLYTVGYDSSRLSDKIAIAEAWFRRIRIELALYYRIVAAKNRQMTDWHALIDSVNEIVETQRLGGLQAFLARTFRRKATNEALIDLALFEMEEIESHDSLNRQILDRYGERGRGLLKPFITQCMDELPRRPIGQVGGLLQRFEGRRVTDRDLVFIVFSSVIGAAVGAAATLISAG